MYGYLGSLVLYFQQHDLIHGQQVLLLVWKDVHNHWILFQTVALVSFLLENTLHALHAAIANVQSKASHQAAAIL